MREKSKSCVSQTEKQTKNLNKLAKELMDRNSDINHSNIKKLSQHQKSQILDYCHKREKENLFIIGSFKNYKKPFSVNKYYCFLHFTISTPPIFLVR